MRFITALRPTARIAPRIAVLPRPFHQARILRGEEKDSNGSFIDGLAEGEAKGTTGGGEPLDSSSKNAPPQPKVSNQSIRGNYTDDLTEEQKREVDEHNKDFDKKHDRGNTAPGDKVDKAFWAGERHGEKDKGKTKPDEEGK
ncbi:hypothetical protein NW762_001481 [Fusarium torreyae]|uniref:Uncharacterized protein n=1 Tax=Fusarium torreyae TaxID=1237075 RepID=A0A9W8VLK7_9HYPO|nr:hypothetical protein NW762_001481 [Fusarium torreyae]